MAARAVSGSTTVPAPITNPAGSVGAISPMSSIARGTVIVTSSAVTPPVGERVDDGAEPRAVLQADHGHDAARLDPPDDGLGA